MVYGYSGGGISAQKGALGNDATSSERLRIQAAQEQKKRFEKEKAKQSLAEAKRKYDHDRMEVSHRETELRRLNIEIAKSEKDIQEITGALKLTDKKEHDIKVRSSEQEIQIKDLEKEIAHLKLESDKKSHEVRTLELELQKLQQKLIEAKREVSEYGARIQSIGLQIRQIDGLVHKSKVDTERARSEKMYKEKDIENKTRMLNVLRSKKDHEATEINRLKSEMQNLEREIKDLEQKSR